MLRWAAPLRRGLGLDDPEDWDVTEATLRNADGPPEADARAWAGEEPGWYDEDLYAPSDCEAVAEGNDASEALGPQRFPLDTDDSGCDGDDKNKKQKRKKRLP